jgi:jumonji domain-containing protein 7
MEAAIITAINTYHELNPSVVDELHEEPSPLEFMRHVARNRPFVVRNAATEWTAFKAWDAKYLREAMEGESVNVSITPVG